MANLSNIAQACSFKRIEASDVRFSHSRQGTGRCAVEHALPMQSFPHSDDYAHFIAELRAVREAAGLTQTALAERLHIDRTLVSKAESGVRRLDIMELRLWLRALGMDLPSFVARLEARLARHARPS